MRDIQIVEIKRQDVHQVVQDFAPAVLVAALVVAPAVLVAALVAASATFALLKNDWRRL